MMDPDSGVVTRVCEGCGWIVSIEPCPRCGKDESESMAQLQEDLESGAVTPDLLIENFKKEFGRNSLKRMKRARAKYMREADRRP